MAAPTGTFQTYQAIGDREDLIDIITNISPIDTWFTQVTGSVRATAVRHEWQTDALAAAAANAQVEGDDATATNVTPTVRLQNSCQILWKVFQISETQQAVNAAGRENEMDYQTMKFSKELARDIEYALVINAAEVTGNATTARQMKGVLGWIVTNVTTATATTVEVSEAAYNDNLQLIWAQGGYPSFSLVGAHIKRVISAFTTNTRKIQAEEKKLVSAVNIYESDFGTIEIRLHQILNAVAPGTVINFGSMELWNKAWLRPVLRTPLAKTGSSDKYKIEAELTLESRQEKGSGKMTGYKPA